MHQQIPEEFLKVMEGQNQNPVRIERNSMQKISDNEKTKSDDHKTRSYAVQLGSSTLVLEKTNESPIPEAYRKKTIDQLCQMEQQKKIYYQVVIEEPSSSSTSKDIATQIRGGHLGKSGPGARAHSDALKAANNANKPKAAKSKSGGSYFAEAWSSNPSKRSRPAAANRLAQQFQTAPAEGGNGLFGRFSARSTPDPSNPGCAGGPRSIKVLSQSKSSKPDFVREITTHNGVKAKLTDKSTNHLTSKHAHQVGIDDPLPPLPNQKPGKYPFANIRTRINKENKKQFCDILENILHNTNTDPYPGVDMHGIKGQGFHTEDYGGEGGFFIGIHEEGPFKGQIKKAQPISEQQLEILKKFNKID
jgi:hypothetical protein